MLKKPSYRDKIKSIARDRDVNLLLHFTQYANLPGIVKHGLLSRNALKPMDYTAFTSSEHRFDKNDDAISVSISGHNSWMFDSKRHGNSGTDWVFLALEPDILWEQSCVFCWRNAGTNEILDWTGFRGGPWAFDKMFEGSDEDRMGLEPRRPTDPQAEVQVLERIAPERILGAIVNREGMVRPVSEILSGLPGYQREVLVEGF